MTIQLNLILRNGQRIASGYRNLLANYINASDHLAHWMLDLNARVHFDEVKATIFVQKLKGSGAHIAHVLASGNTGF